MNNHSNQAKFFNNSTFTIIENEYTKEEQELIDLLWPQSFSSPDPLVDYHENEF